MMRKAKYLLVALLLSLLISGCGASSEESSSDDGASQVGGRIATEAVNTEEDSEIESISKEDFSSYFRVVDITTDNWDDYFHFTDREDIAKDAFGDPNGTVTIYKMIEQNDNQEILGDGVVFRFLISYVGESGNYDAGGNKVSGENQYESSEEMDITIWEGDLRADILEIGRENPAPDNENLTFKMSRNISDISCTRVRGQVLLGEIPDSAWTEVGDDQCIVVADGDGMFYYFYDDGSVGHGSTADSMTRVETASSSSSFYELPIFARWSGLKKFLEIE